MMTELVLVEGVSDVQLISYYLQNVYGWKHERDNRLGSGFKSVVYTIPVLRRGQTS